MRQIYIVEGLSYRPSVAFASREAAEAVARVCDADVEAVPIIDLDHTCLDEYDGGGDGDAV